MKIAFVTDLGDQGGAAIAASRAGAGLVARGHHVTRLHRRGTLAPPGSASEFREIGLPSEWPMRLWSVARGELSRTYLQSAWRREFRRVLAEIRPDAICLNNLHASVWDIEVAEECLASAPVVWTLHDMWPFTGSCAYSFDCRRFEIACGADCPEAGAYPTLPRGMIASAHARRLRLFSRRPRLAFAAPSLWMRGEAERGARGNVPVAHVPYGLDPEMFRPLDPREARALLKVPEDGRPLLLAAAAALSERRKGIDILLRALAGLAEFRPRLLLMGAAPPASFPEGIDARPLGPVAGEALMAAVYSAADLFVHPALADNQPLVVLEAMACGAPTVALPVGGLPEMIEPGKTGWIAAAPDADALREALRAAFASMPALRAMRAECRGRAVRLYAADLNARRMELLFERAVAGNGIDQASLDALGS